ncbi:uncharacterized protein LOC121736613 isoform X2 [Aricia agestis]|uniref:uncharacterized protein LOC121736613 isoform X2 n=1 Tax=Aricia agestis TaxID=91739 RepID=UPI001C2031C7|nr:uncharacterized protein LOC121736613 isoform X2 [Aricia agestis]
MSDKGFGDHINRNIVKNPLLSSAVTGLSIEDLTHNAVLLPAVPAQEMSSRQDKQTAEQTCTLGDANRNFQGGDVHFNAALSNLTLDDGANNNQFPNANATKSKKDDFDVNEYFARLQGTRYVSAPINTTQTLPETLPEESLEEINLNEEKQTDDAHSLTSDIAQNFSQLPTVLPQVASVVFSSFSNMLNLKSREQTPDEYNVREVAKPEMVQPKPEMFAPPPVEVKEVAPPPLKEPPATGLPNYRITTKKKVYAQIPGLSHEAQGSHTFPMASQAPPTYFLPDGGHQVLYQPANATAPVASEDNSQDRHTNTGMLGHDISIKPTEIPSVIDFSNPHVEDKREYEQQANAIKMPPFSLPPQQTNYNPTTQQTSTSSPPQQTPFSSPPQQTSFSLQTQEPTINPALKQTALQQMTANTSPQTTLFTSPPQQTAFSSPPQQTPFSSLPQQTPFSSPPQQTPFSSATQHIAVSSLPQQTPFSSPPQQTPFSSPPQQTPFSSPPQQTSFSSPPQQTPLSSPPQQTPFSSPPQQTPFSSQPQQTPFSTKTQPMPFSFPPQQPPFNPPPQSTNLQSQQTPYNLPSQQTPVIPPPPMFSNQQRRDSQTSVEKTILPPSVARRIAGSQPVMKQSTPSNIDMQNIFVPNMDVSSSDNVALNQHKQPQPAQMELTQNEGQNASVPAFFQPHQPGIKSASGSEINTNNPQPNAMDKFGCAELKLSQDVQSQPSSEISKPDTALFYNPNSTPAGTDSKPYNAAPDNSLGQYLSQNTALPPNDPPKQVAEPPKMTSSINFRLNKKRPQYYAGPIEGVGSISNNVKPIINPVQPSTFQGSLFTPNVEEPVVNPASNYPVADQSSTPFDISQTPDTFTSYDYNNQQDQTPVYNTPFDMSRPTTESVEQSTESKGFGIIGSLKSKLSSIDINKLQNTVTTFFDPAYNTKVEQKTGSDNFGQYQSVPQYSENDRSIEMFVPTVDQTQGYYQNYQAPGTDYYHQNQRYPNDPNVQYHNQGNSMTSNYYNWYGNQPQDNLDSMYGSNVNQNQHLIYQENIQHTVPTQTGATTIPSAPILESNPDSSHINQDGSGTSNFFKSSPQQQIFENISSPPANKIDLGFEPLAKTLNSSISEQDVVGRVTEISENKFDSRQNQPNQEAVTFYNFGQENKATAANSENNLQSTFTSQYQQSGTVGLFNTPITQSQLFADAPLMQNIDKEPPSTDTQLYSLMSANKSDNMISSSECFDKEDQLNINSNAQSKEQDIHNESIKSQDNYFTDNSLHKFSDFSESSDKDEEFCQSKYDQDFYQPKYEGAPLSFVGCEKKEAKAEQKSLIAEHQVKPTDIFQSMPSLGINDFKDLCIPFSIEQSFNSGDSNTKSGTEKIDDKSKDTNVSTQPLLSYFQQTSNEISASLFSQATSSSVPVTNIDVLHSKKDSAVEGIENQVSELNICETCREVNKPEVEEKEVEDLTTQLIENITAPIQLLNPVGGLTDSTFSETPVPENIIENIKPVIELLEDDSPAPAYGWSVEDSYEPNATADHTYSQTHTESNISSFFQNKSLSYENIPKNASDEIKAEYQSSQDDYSNLLRQLGLPNAPADDETKSDEGCIDVHSIEQDAKNDFPIYDEFTIEPSETDDDKIETMERTRSFEEPSEEPPVEPESFTHRVERYKRLETAVDATENVFDIHKDTKPLNVPTSISPAITIASYFDTGNYAVETHYKNSLTSPTDINTYNFDSQPSMSIPPGFEEEYKRRMSGTGRTLYSGSNIIQSSNIISDNRTQTSVSTLSEYTESPKTCDNQTEEIEELKNEPVESERLPAFANIVKSQPEPSESISQAVKDVNKSQLNVQEEKKPLEDPISFFSAPEPTEQPDAYSNFSRLSSYFATPSKPDHSKSFFELSESQNHYRHNQTANKSEAIESSVKTFFKNKIPAANIPSSLAQTDLVNDLTSTAFFSPKDVFTTVGYCTVEYDACSPDNVGKPEIPLKRDIGDEIEIKNGVGDTDMVGNIESIIKRCKICCDITAGVRKIDVNTKYIKFRKCMDETLNKSDQSGDEKMATKEENKSVTVNFLDHALHEEHNDEVSLMAKNRTSAEYSPVKYHWFYQVDSEDKSNWRGFSVADSAALENAYNSPDLTASTTVPTDGGRYDVNVVGRLRTAVYWQDTPTNVIRCSWFYKGTTDGRYVPYSEEVSELLEDEYRHGVRTGEWHRRLLLPDGAVVVMHGPTVMVHFHSAAQDLAAAANQSLGKPVYRNPPKQVRFAEDQCHRIDHLVLMVHGAGELKQHPRQSAVRTWVVRRGSDEADIDETEPADVDHLLFLCHGVGSACDMRFRPVEKVVDDFRATSLQLIQSHYKNSYESGTVGRIEVLPISWHWRLHSGETGVDRRLAAVTLDSIPRLRAFTNDTILDVLFYTSPVYCQTIVDTVCGELNRIYALFRARNPRFRGGVSLGGHSLGSVILYDLLCHQTEKPQECPSKRYVSGAAGTGQPTVRYPALDFSPDALYALGSPIAIFECIRGVDVLGQDFKLPTCKNFFNIFHPYDPIAYRIEPMINPVLRDVKPLLIPHHKGRKRMHLELKDTMARVGADIKQRVIETIKSTWSSVWKTAPPPTDHQLEKVVEEELEKEQLTEEPKEDKSCDVQQALPEMLGQLNGGRRVDHVLQEAPLEMINEYLFAMSSHVGYWESEDTMLLILREIYDAVDVRPDAALPQPNMTVERTRRPQDSPVHSDASTSRNAS